MIISVSQKVSNNFVIKYAKPSDHHTQARVCFDLRSALMVGPWLGTCDHYDAGGAVPNFVVLGLADVNQDPGSWMDLGAIDKRGFFMGSHWGPIWGSRLHDDFMMIS